ncbi:hypothetical protein AYB34_17065 [Leptospira sp. ZV016]|nr:hypothetical protein AYB34_17065 [Leptospira sp. ZV016]
MNKKVTTQTHENNTILIFLSKLKMWELTQNKHKLRNNTNYKSFYTFANNTLLIFDAIFIII